MLLTMGTETHSSEPPSPQHYEKIGRFVVGFEQVVNMMRLGVLVLLEKYGLEHDELGLIVTADLNANDVLGILRSIFGTHFRLNPDPHLVRVAHTLFRDIQKLLQRRNELLHSFWSDEVPSDDVTRLGYRFTKTKGGIDVRDLPSLNLLEDDVKKTHLLFELLEALIAVPGRTDVPDLHKAFKFDKNGKLYFDEQFAESIGF